MISHLVKDKNRIYPLFAILLSTFGFISSLFFVKEEWVFLYFVAVSIILVFFGYGRAFVRIMFIGLPIIIICFVPLYLLYGFKCSIENSYRSLSFILFAVISLSIKPAEMMTCFNQIKIPRILSLGILISLSFAKVLVEELKRIKLAMKTRSVYDGLNLNLIYRAFVVPLIIRMISISDTLSASLETRAFIIGAEYSVYKSIKISIRDYAFLIIFLFIIFLGFYLKYLI